MKACSKCKVSRSLDMYGMLKTRGNRLRAECNDCRRRYRQDSRIAIQSSNKEYYAGHKSSHALSMKLWRNANPGKIRTYNSNRRALESGTVLSDTWDVLIKLYGDRCMYPDCERMDITLDHIVPLSKGGAHAVDNFQILCKRHNSIKGNRNSIDYRPELVNTKSYKQ